MFILGGTIYLFQKTPNNVNTCIHMRHATTCLPRKAATANCSHPPKSQNPPAPQPPTVTIHMLPNPTTRLPGRHLVLRHHPVGAGIRGGHHQLPALQHQPPDGRRRQRPRAVAAGALPAHRAPHLHGVHADGPGEAADGAAAGGVAAVPGGVGAAAAWRAGSNGF